MTMTAEHKRAALAFFKSTGLRAQHGRWILQGVEYFCLPVWMIRRMHGGLSGLSPYGGWTCVYNPDREICQIDGNRFERAIFSVCKSGDRFSRTDGIAYALRNSRCWGSILKSGMQKIRVLKDTGLCLLESDVGQE